MPIMVIFKIIYHTLLCFINIIKTENFKTMFALLLWNYSWFMHYIGNDKGDPNVTTMKIIKTNDEKIYLNVNPNTKTRQIVKKYKQKHEVCKQKGKQIFIVINVKT